MSQYGYQPYQQFPPPPPPAPRPKAKVPVWAILLAVGVSLLLLCGLGVAGLIIYRATGSPSISSQPEPSSWEEGVTRIDGVTDLRTGLSNLHTEDPVSYPQRPPVGGDHHRVWQNCDGIVYPAPIIDEHAVHSLEHGTVWITYQPELSSREVAKLARLVDGVNHTMLSPYPGQDSAVSVQAWGFQLKVDSASDPRIEEFLKYAPGNAGLEPGGPCTGGTTVTR